MPSLCIRLASRPSPRLLPQRPYRLLRTPTRSLQSPAARSKDTHTKHVPVERPSKPMAPMPHGVSKTVKDAPTGKLLYPKRLLVYHAGTKWTVYLAMTRMTGILLVIYAGGLVAPAYYYSPAIPDWHAVAVVAASLVPIGVMTLGAAPFVTYMHLHLPQWARMSQARLLKYAAALPSSAEIDVTSMRWVWPRVTRLQASELSVQSGQITGAMTLRRTVPQHVADARPWYAWRPIKRFYIGGKAGTKTAEPGVWEGVLGSLSRSWSRTRSALLKEKEQQPFKPLP